MKHKILLSVLFLFSLWITGQANAQSSTGTLEGTVLDANQRPIYNATVTVIQTTTHRKLSIKTTRAGVYSFPGLDSGQYEITVNAPSFGSEQVLGVTVDVGGSATKDFVLKPGAENTTVTVNADSDIIQRDTSGQSNVISQELLENIPLPDHSTLGLVTLIPGVVGDPAYANGVQSENPGIFTNPAIPGASLSIGGSRPGLVSQLIDGFDITQSGYPRAGLTFTPFAIKTISVQFAGLPAEFGRSGGGIINQASQQGGTQYHGTFEYRHTDPGIGQATRVGSINRPDVHQTIYGGVISGPVGIPGSKKIKNAFFLFTYEPLRQRNVQFSRGRLATPSELAGKLFDTGPNGVISLDVLSAQCFRATGCATGVGYAAAVALATCTLPRDVAQNCTPGGPNTSSKLYYQFPLDPVTHFPVGNKLGNPNNTAPCGTPLYPAAATVLQTCIPNNDLSFQNAHNPVAQFIAAHSPTPTNPGPYAVFDNALGTYANDTNNAYLARGVLNHDDRYSIRLDYSFPNNDHIFARYSIVPVSGQRYNYLGPSNPLNTIPTDELTSSNYALNYVHLFGSRIVNESRISYIRGYRNRLPPVVDLSTDIGAGLGLSPATNGVGLAALSFDNGLGQYGGGGSFQDGGRTLDEGYGTGNETTIIAGRHQIKFGGEYRALQLNRKDVANNYGGTYTFAGNESSGSGGQPSSLASFNQGIVNTFLTAGTQAFYYRWKYIAGFVQDTYKLAPNFTVNFGVRYNLETPRQEKFDLQGSFLPNVTGVLTNPGSSTIYPVTGGLVRNESYGLGKGLFPTNYAGVEPRIGFTYSPYRFMVFRAGYALIHTPLTGISNSISPNFAPAAQQVGPLNGGVLNTGANATVAKQNLAPLDFISNPAVPITRLGAITNQNPIFSYTNNGLLPVIDQTNVVPYVESWNVGFQFLLGKSTTVDVTYIGQKGVHLFLPLSATNLPDQNQLMALQQAHAATNVAVPNAFGLGGETAIQLTEPFQQFFNNALNQTYKRGAYSNYNGLYLTGRRQVSRELSILGGFTWSKSMDNNSTPTADGVQIDNFGLTYPQNPYTLDGDYSASSFDQPARVTMGYNYVLPFGKNQRFLNKHRILDLLVGGFTTSGYFSAQSGYPLSVGEGNNGYFLSQLPLSSTKAIGGCNSQFLGACGVTQLYNHIRPNILPGVPLINPAWKTDKTGIRTGLGFLNEFAFQAPGSRDAPAYGNARRTLTNARNPRSVNFDASVRKNIRINDRTRMVLFCDVQNVANHPNFFISSGINVFSGSLVNTTNPDDRLSSINGPFNFNANFSAPNAFSAARTVNVGASISF